MRMAHDPKGERRTLIRKVDYIYDRQGLSGPLREGKRPLEATS